MILFLGLVSILMIGRFVIINVFSSDQELDISYSYLVRCLQFDMQSSIFITLPFLTLTLFQLFFPKILIFEKVQKIYFLISLCLCALVVSINIGFFSEYKEQFNDWIIRLFREDLIPIIKVIYKDHHPILILVGIFLLGVVLWLGIGKIFYFTRVKSDTGLGVTKKIVFSVFMIALCVLVMRGSTFRGRPLNDNDKVISSSIFLNKLTLSPTYCLYKEIGWYIDSCKALNGKSIKINKEDLKMALSTLSDHETGLNLDDVFRKESKGPFIKKPKHIFLIIGESQTAYPMWGDEKYKWIMPFSEKLKNESLYSTRCISASMCTSSSLKSIVSGLPESNIEITMVDFPKDYSISNIFKGLGYKMKFYYSGPLTWCSMDKLFKQIDFDSQLGGWDIPVEKRGAYWGARDDELFSKVISDVDDESSVYVILTVSNHPPYDIALEKFGCPKDAKNYSRELAHAWYADKCIYDFINSIKEKYPDSIFVVTGDHPSRIEVEDKSNERECFVPLMFIGNPIVEAAMNKEVGACSHLDIIPTLIELISPKSTEYFSIGKSILERNQTDIIANGKFIYRDGNVFSNSTPNFRKEDKQIIGGMSDISRWLIINGKDLEKEK